MNFDTIDDLKDFVSEQVEDIIAKAETVPAKSLGLDNRCGTFYVDNDREWVAIGIHNLRLVRYYGGFEYIDAEYVDTLGDYVFYSVEAERVREALEVLDGTDDEEDDPDDE